MLQIVTKMYFRDGIPLRTNEIRRVLYSNRHVVTSGEIRLPVGSLVASGSHSERVFAFTVTVIEHLEAKDLDGSDSVLAGTSGYELVDDLAVVLSFRTNSLFTRDIDLARRLLSESGRRRDSATTLFKDTFDDMRFLSDEEIDDFRVFLTALLSLTRSRYEAAMRAIRRAVRATQRAVDDPTLAYVDMVAALESLADTAATKPSWDRLDQRKRKLLDTALAGASQDVVDRVQGAVLDAEQTGARWRFQHFVLDHITPEYFREEAAGQRGPARRPDLSLALNNAYGIRSRSVHSLDALPDYIVAFGEHGDTIRDPAGDVMFTLQGLARLTRHVVGNVVERAPTDLDTTFDWRTAIPGTLEVQMAPQYWIWKDAGYTHASSIDYFTGFADLVLALMAGDAEGVPPMDPVLDQIERLVPATQPSPQRTSMIALYCAWHGAVHRDLHRPNADAFIDNYGATLDEPSMVAFVTGVITGRLADWTEDQWIEVGEARRTDRARRKHASLAIRFDAALHAVISEKLHAAARAEEALRFAGFAIDELPGDPFLLGWEAALSDDTATEIDIMQVLTGVEQNVDDAPDSPDAKPAAAPDSPEE